MGTTIELTTSVGTTIDAYEARPDGTPKGGLVVVQEIFGVNHHIRNVTDRFAADGYLAIAPAIFDPAERGVELAYDEAGVARGSALARKVSREASLAAVDAAVAACADAGPVAVVGFCLGGTLAFAAAARNDRLGAAVAYYGGGIAGLAGTTPRCRVLFHFGEKDGHISAADVDTVRRAYPDLPLYTYPAGHGFNCDERGSFDQASAELAWTRTLAFLERELGLAA